MKIQLLIALCDSDYVEHLSQVLIEKKSDVFEVSVCSSPKRLPELLTGQRFDVALLDDAMAEGAELSKPGLCIYLWDGSAEPVETVRQLPRIHRYQRISSIVGEIVEQYAASQGPKERFGQDHGGLVPRRRQRKDHGGPGLRGAAGLRRGADGLSGPGALLRLLRLLQRAGEEHQHRL